MSKIEIIGLGAGDYDQLPLGIYKKLMNHRKAIFTRTKEHPVIASLEKEGVPFESFDHIYGTEDQFEHVYQRIVATLVENAKKEPIIYTVPGHPMLAELTVQLLLEQKDVDVEVIGGQSYLDDLFTALKIDPIDGFQFVDGTMFTRSQLDLRHHLIFSQVYDRMIASNVKLALLEDLPADYEITIVEAAGSKQEKLTNIPLMDLDRTVEVSNLTSVYIPPAPRDYLHHTFTNLRGVIAALRAPDGCPWDREQTHESLREHAIEEVYELIEAIDNEDDDGIIEELGDVLLQVMLHSQIGEDDGFFTVEDVIKTITEKMIHRHPHVFGETKADTVEAVNKNWEELKKEEKNHDRTSILDGIPPHLPSLAKAYKLQKKAAKVGFDWDDVNAIYEKLDEELAEVNEAIQSEDKEEMEKEFGDVLFVLANLTRYYKINPEIALNRTNQKFLSRFSYVEEQVTRQGKELQSTPLEEMDAYWNEAKESE